VILPERWFDTTCARIGRAVTGHSHPAERSKDGYVRKSGTEGSINKIFHLGYHASDPGDFAAEMREIAALDPEEALSMRARARNTANDRFSERNFDDGWMKAWKALVELKV
jgi:hypothetical protein